MAQLYAAHVPIYKKPGSTDGKAFNAAVSQGATKVYSIVPYIVSGAIADDFIILGSIGAVLHVLAWIFAIVTDIMTALDTGGAGGSVAQLIMTILAFVFLVVVWVWHLVMYCTKGTGIPDGMIPPSILSFITGPVLISLIFSFLYLQIAEGSGTTSAWFNINAQALANAAPSGPPSPPSTPPDGSRMLMEAAEMTDLQATSRWYVILGLISKVMVYTFLQNNIRWGGSASD